MKRIFFLVVCLIFSNTLFSQTFSFAGWTQTGGPQWRGRTFSKDAYTFTRTTGGNTMTARLSSTGGCTEVFDAGNVVKTTDCFVACDCSGSGPTYGPGNNAPTNAFTSSLVIGMDWSNTTSSSTLDLSFTIGVSNPNFTIRDANTNNNFADLIVVSGVNCSGTTVFPSSVTGMAGGTVYNSATGTISQSIIDNSARGNGGSNITVNFTGIVTSIRIVYRSNPTIPVGSNPSAQFIHVGQIVSTLSPCPLPIELNSFEGTYLGRGQKKLDWITTSELNNDYFTIEHSTDAINFSEVKRIDGAGTTNRQQVYSTIVSENSSDYKYYRLGQTDFNGAHTYSNVIYVADDEMMEEISLYPNPATDKVTLTFDNISEGDYVIILSDLVGKEILREKTTVTKNSFVSINTQDLELGNYMVKVVHLESGQQKKLLRFIKAE